jgi:hypothetical protein
MAYLISKVISTAEAEVGYLEKKTNSSLDSKTANAGYNNYTKYARDFDSKYPDFYNGKKNGYDWCDMFVDWCFVTAFGVTAALKLLGQPKKSCGAGCPWSADYFKKIGRFYTSPKAGDQIFFKGSNGKPCHTGLVYKVDSTYVYTIEGNTSSASGVVANGGCVAKKKYAKTSSYIYGYGRPDYGPQPEPTPTLETKGFKKGDNTTGVFAVKNLLILAKKAKIITQGVDNNNVFGEGTEKAVNQVLKKLGYKQNGIAGNSFIKKLSNLIGKEL